MKVTFIGLGIMGSRMAQNLRKHQIDLTVYNRSIEKTDALLALGATVAQTPLEAVKDADVVFSMLSTPEVVQSIFLGESGVLQYIKPGAIWVDCSTVNPSFSKTVSKQAKDMKVNFLDAPVAGSKPQAEQAELAFFVGGDTEILSVVEPLFKHMGSKVLHIGEPGQGAAFKMVVNVLLAQSMLMFSEATILGQKMGISREFMLEVLPNLPVSAPFTKMKAEGLKSENYDVQFPLEWMYKDLHLACLSAYEHNQSLFLASITKEVYADAYKSGMGRLDFSAIHKFLEEK